MADTPEYKEWAEKQRKLLADARRKAKKRRKNQEYYARRKRNKRVFYRKKCSKCGQIKSGIDFYADKRSKDGLYSQCKLCHSESIRKKYPKKT